MRTLVTAFFVLMLLVSVPARAQTPSAPCRAEQSAFVATGVVQSRALPYFIEVDLTFQNSTAGPVRIDPGRFVLLPDAGRPVAPSGRDEVLAALRRPWPTTVDIFGFFSLGSLGVTIGVGTVDLERRAIEARLLRLVDIAPGTNMRGSVYFRPEAWPARFTLVLDGLRSAETALPAMQLRDCVLPVRPLAPPAAIASPPPVPRTFTLSARAQHGPLAVSVLGIEMTRLATTLTIVVENTADLEASLFVAIGQAQLVDPAGKAYAVRMLRSTLPDRVGARDQVRGQLVLEPLPLEPAATSLVLTMPGARVGDAVYDLRVDLLF